MAVVFGPGEHPVGSDRITIWGYTAWSDFSIRDTVLGLSKTDHGPLTWSLTKNFRTGNSCGPYLVVDEGPPVDNLRITLTVVWPVPSPARLLAQRHPDWRVRPFE